MKAVPDLVEEIEITADGTGIDREYLKFVLNEWDDQALEEALLVKEATGAEVVALGLGSDPDIDASLYTAIAKGADRAVRLTGAGEVPDTATRARAVAGYLRDHPADLVITGVQAPDDLDGQLPATLGALLGHPHVSVVVSVALVTDPPEPPAVRVRQEFAGGRAAELVVDLPAVIGLQAARQAPRYAPISRIRQVMAAGGIEQVDPGLAPGSATGASGLAVRRMHAPEKTSHAQMLTGSADEVAGQIVDLLRSRGLVKG
ncbi:MAG: electron transfer flavoprotein subunit beta/FixA family protein [Actinomycetes bacterium]